jgi:hypothetical protein
MTEQKTIGGPAPISSDSMATILWCLAVEWLAHPVISYSDRFG